MRYSLYMVMVVVGAWSLLLAVWGFSMVYLNFGTRGLWLANEARQTGQDTKHAMPRDDRRAPSA